MTSSAKRKLHPGSTRISQTPDGSFYSLQQNAAELLRRCGVVVPALGGVQEYLRRGPGFIFLFHPALGPLWEVIAQKIRGGSIAGGCCGLAALGGGAAGTSGGGPVCLPGVEARSAGDGWALAAALLRQPTHS